MARVARAELGLGGADNAAKAFEHAQALEKIVLTLPPAEGRDAARKQEERERSLSRMLVFQSHARSVTGQKEEAERLAARAFAAFPNEDSAHEWATALAALGRSETALQPLAPAFT